MGLTDCCVAVSEMPSAGASDVDCSPALGSTDSCGAGSVLPVSLGRGRENVDGESSEAVAVVVSPMPAAFTPIMTASPPSSPMTTATPTRARSPVRTGRFSVFVVSFQTKDGSPAIVRDVWWHGQPTHTRRPARAPVRQDGPMQSPLRHGRAAIGTTIAGGALAALSQAPDRASRLLRHRYPTVAVTGMTGVGKTRLADRLSRRASVQSSPESGQDVGSAVMERRTRRNARLRGYRFRVVPGENAATRLGALDEVFHDEPVDGVLHVVANGYATPRRTGGTSGAARATREEQLAAELEDWAITAHRIASMAVRRDRPTWLVVAVTKADLFADDVDAAVHYYSPGSGSPFGDKLDELRALAGGAKLSIDVLPVCATQGSGKKPSAAEKSCADLLARLELRLAQLSGH